VTTVSNLLAGLVASPTRRRDHGVHHRLPASLDSLAATVTLAAFLSEMLTGCTFTGGTSSPSTGDGLDSRSEAICREVPTAGDQGASACTGPSDSEPDSASLSPLPENSRSGRPSASPSPVAPWGSTVRWPGPGDTGVPAGTSLKASGAITVTTPNTVIDGLDVSGTVTIAASGVVIKNSKIHGSGTYGVYTRSGDVTIYDSEIYGFENGIGSSRWSAYRVNIHGTYGDGVKLGSNVTLQDSWIHDLTPAAEAHADGGQMQSGVTNLVVRHNTIDLASTKSANSALFIAPSLGPSSVGPVTIIDNWLDGGNFTVFIVDGDDGRYYVENITLSENRFGRHARYGPLRVNVPAITSNNVWADTGVPIRDLKRPRFDPTPV